MATMIFYSVNTRDTGMIGMVQHSENDDFKRRIQASVRTARNYEHVCDFDDTARDHDDIWEALQSEVSEIPRLMDNRSMMVGDILVTDSGSVFVVMSSGFQLIEGDGLLTTSAHLHAEFSARAKLCADKRGRTVPCFSMADKARKESYYDEVDGWGALE